MVKKLYSVLMMSLLIIVLTACGAASNNQQSGSNQQQTGSTQNPASGVTDQNEDELVLLDSSQHPEVTIEMSDGGIIKVELYPEVAPNTVKNFISLVQAQYYDGQIFHRVIPNFMIQGGDPTGTGAGGPGYTIAGEFTRNGFINKLKHTRGVISMARSNHYDSAGSQFFIVQAEETPTLDQLYAGFGKVIEGMDVVDRIVMQERDRNDKPLDPLVMTKVTVDLKGLTFDEPKKIENLFGR